MLERKQWSNRCLLVCVIRLEPERYKRIVNSSTFLYIALKQQQPTGDESIILIEKTNSRRENGETLRIVHYFGFNMIGTEPHTLLEGFKSINRQYSLLMKEQLSHQQKLFRSLNGPILGCTPCVEVPWFTVLSSAVQSITMLTHIVYCDAPNCFVWFRFFFSRGNVGSDRKGRSTTMFVRFELLPKKKLVNLCG